MGEFLIVDKIKTFSDPVETEHWTVNIDDIKRVEPVSCNIYVMKLSDESIFVSGEIKKINELLRAQALS